MGEETEKNIQDWLNGLYDPETKNAIRDLKKTDPKQLEEAFSGYLSFGTGGMRGLVGVGPNRMNIYTVREATYGLALYLKKCFPNKLLSVVIGYDSRKTSRPFAFEAARTLAQQGIEAHIFHELRPVPLVSFGTRYLHADAGIMITASHNPPQYNGYKVYWNDGGQVLPPHDVGIIKEIDAIRGKGVVSASTPNDPYIHIIYKELDTAYLDEIRTLQLFPAVDKSLLHVVYSPLHGAGGVIVPQALYQDGIKTLSFVRPQMVADGVFSTTASPNPEEPEALSLGIEQMIQEGADLFLATDPDADRLGVVVNHHASPIILTGNQIASLMIEGICSRLSSQNELPPRMAVVETIVTSPLVKAITERYGGMSVQVLTGFKYIAEKIRQWESEPNAEQFLFGCEESYGTLYGTHARDKDAVEACCLISEIAWDLKKQGKTLFDGLEDIWRKYGYYEESTISCAFSETKEGRSYMVKTMSDLRTHPPKTIGEAVVVALQDLSTKSFVGNDCYRIAQELPKADVLLFTLEDGSKIIVRPSGTEPKVKVYLMMYAPLGSLSLEAVRRQVGATSKSLVAAIRALFR